MDSSDDWVSGCCGAISIVCVFAMIAAAVLLALAIGHSH